MDEATRDHLAGQVVAEATVLAESLAADPQALRALVHAEATVFTEAASAHGIKADDPDALVSAFAAEAVALEAVLAAEPLAVVDATSSALAVAQQLTLERVVENPKLLVHLLAAEATSFEP